MPEYGCQPYTGIDPILRSHLTNDLYKLQLKTNKNLGNRVWAVWPIEWHRYV